MRTFILTEIRISGGGAYNRDFTVHEHSAYKEISSDLTKQRTNQSKCLHIQSKSISYSLTSFYFQERRIFMQTVKTTRLWCPAIPLLDETSRGSYAPRPMGTWARLHDTVLEVISPPFQSESLCEGFHMKISFIHAQILVHLRVNKTNFHMKGFALGLALKQRRKATRKSPIDTALCSTSLPC